MEAGDSERGAGVRPACASPRALGLEVRRFVTEHRRRRVVPTTVHLGLPGGPRRDLVADPGWDAGMRVEVLLRLLESAGRGSASLLWLSRSGDAEVLGSDLAWLRAARTAAPTYDVAVESFVVVTRSGWRDLVTDASRVWARARPLRGDGSARGG